MVSEAVRKIQRNVGAGADGVYGNTTDSKVLEYLGAHPAAEMTAVQTKSLYQSNGPAAFATVAPTFALTFAEMAEATDAWERWKAVKKFQKALNDAVAGDKVRVDGTYDAETDAQAHAYIRATSATPDEDIAVYDEHGLSMVTGMANALGLTVGEMGAVNAEQTAWRGRPSAPTGGGGPPAGDTDTGGGPPAGDTDTGGGIYVPPEEKTPLWKWIAGGVLVAGALVGGYYWWKSRETEKAYGDCGCPGDGDDDTPPFGHSGRTTRKRLGGKMRRGHRNAKTGRWHSHG